MKPAGERSERAPTSVRCNFDAGRATLTDMDPRASTFGGPARPKLSVLIFTFNRQAMLAQCLDSVLLTSVDCEIVVFDDASTDGTFELVHAYADRDPRIRYFRSPTNVGVIANMEIAAVEARGEFVALLPDDDSVEPGNYERKVAILDAYPRIGFVYSLAYAVDENMHNRQVIRRREHIDCSYIGGRSEFSDLISGNYISGNSVVFRRSLVEQHGIMDPTLPPTLSDWDLWLRFAFQAETAFINEPLVNFRFHGGGMSSQASSDMAMGMIPVWRKWLVDRQDPPVLDRRTWERMQAVFFSEVQRLHPSDVPKAQACVTAFEDLRKAAAANASLAFARRTRSIMARPDTQTTTSLVWIGPSRAIGGIGSDLRGMTIAATASAISLRLENLELGDDATGPEPNDRHQLDERSWQPLALGNNHIRVWQGPLAYLRPDSGTRATVARVAVDNNETPPAQLIETARDVQALWLPNQFQCDTLLECGIPAEKLRVLSSCVEVDDEAEGEKIDLGTGRQFNFLASMHLPDGAFELVVQTFVREFQPSENVALVVVVRKPPSETMEQLGADVRAWIEREVGSGRPFPTIAVRVGPFDEATLAGLVRASQAYVEPRPSRWGRGALEAMAHAVPVVGARFAGNVDLLSQENSFSTTSRITPQSLGRLMRQAFTAPETAHRRGLCARIDVAVRHSPAAVGRRLRELVDEL